MQEIDEQRAVDRMQIGTGKRSCGRASMTLSINKVRRTRNEPKSTINDVDITDGIALQNQVEGDGYGFSIGKRMNETRYGDLSS